MSTILITGANGFIGSALQAYYKAQGRRVVALTRQNCDYSPVSIRDAVETHNPDIFIHAAGNASVAHSYDNTAGAQGDTVSLTQSVLEGLGGAKTSPRFVYLSSAAVYGNPRTLPLREDSPLNPISPYAEHKLICERLVEQTTFDRAALNIRIFSLFGPAQRRLVLYELYRRFTDPDNDSVPIKGTGLETRDYLSVDIFAKKLAALIDAAEEQGAGSGMKTFNVASGQHRTILECARTIKTLLKSPKNIICEGQEMPGNPPDLQADTSLYDQMVKTPISFDFGAELSKTLDAWNRQEIP